MRCPNHVRKDRDSQLGKRREKDGRKEDFVEVADAGKYVGDFEEEARAEIGEVRTGDEDANERDGFTGE